VSAIFANKKIIDEKYKAAVNIDYNRYKLINYSQELIKK